MREGYLGSAYFLVFLLSLNPIKTQDTLISSDPISSDEIVSDKPVSSEREPDARSAAFAQANSYGGASNSQAIAGVNGEGTANALAPVQSESFSYGYPSPHHPGFSTPGFSQAHASANSGSQGYGDAGLYRGVNNAGMIPNQAYPEFNSFDPKSPYVQHHTPYSGGSTSQAQATAQVIPGTSNPSYSSLSYSSPESTAQTLAQAQSGSSLEQAEANTLSGGRISSNSEQVEADALSIASGQNTGSIIVPPGDYILPNNIPGSDHHIRCSRVGELHYYWSPQHECSVCACVSDRGSLQPVCASCAGCLRPLPQPLAPVPPPPPPHSPIHTQVSCDPLPMDEPFQNPLNPCQTCVCRKSISIYGKPDVHIVCEENQQCVIPPDTTTLPPLPTEPVPQPLCDRFPQNVWFPHPNELCKVCQCTNEYNAYNGISEPHITCIPNADCQSNPAPAPPVLVSTPFPEPPEPYSWPAVTSPPLEPQPSSPSPPGPLPGPSPHESCRPFVPNVPFDHPWDSCQLCVCSEALATGLITIEVSCFTKKECCIEVPPLKPLPGSPTSKPKSKQVSTDLTVYLDPVCELKSFGVEFVHPQHRCRLCSCDLYGHLVAPTCKRLNITQCASQQPLISHSEILYLEPSCRNHQPYRPFMNGCNLCVCQTIFNFVIAKCTPQPNCGLAYKPGGGNRPIVIGTSSSQAVTQAISSSQSGSTLQFGQSNPTNLLLQHIPASRTKTNPLSTAYSPGYSLDQSSALAKANAYTLESQYLQGSMGHGSPVPLYLPRYQSAGLQFNVPEPSYFSNKYSLDSKNTLPSSYKPNFQSVSLAQAEAPAYSTSPYQQGFIGSGPSLSGYQTKYYPSYLQPRFYPSSQHSNYLPTQGATYSEANALTNAASGKFDEYSATAASSANTLSQHLTTGNAYQYNIERERPTEGAGLPDSSLYPSLYSRPNSQLNTLYQSGAYGGGASLASANAISHSSALAQSSATANIGKSGAPSSDAAEEEFTQ